MSSDSQGIPRRQLIKTAAIGTMGVILGEPLLNSKSLGSSGTTPQPIKPTETWMRDRVWAISGNKVLTAPGTPIPRSTLATAIYEPKSAEEISGILKSLPASTPVACVCGGHESSNAACFAGKDAVILDLRHLQSVEFSTDKEGMLVTVGSGVVFRTLVDALRTRKGALPVGTGADVGVVGYAVNGGLSGYFSRRLGLLGQRVTGITVVTADGQIRVLTPADPLFNAILGAGSALAVVVDLTIRVAPAEVVRGGEQRVMVFETRQQAVAFSRRALQLMKELVMPNDSVSMELVVTGTKALVATFVFYDSFKGNFNEFIKPWEDLATEMKLPVVAQEHWTSWFETAAALWPVIAEQKGDPLATHYHAMGTHGIPSDKILDFVCDTVVAESPLDEATLSILEIRCLGGAALQGAKLPSGNCLHTFFLDLVTIYDAGQKSPHERRKIADLTRNVIDKGRTVDGISVDLSGTHSQPDDPDRSAKASVIFGTEAMAASLRQTKNRVDPHNRFRFHPFAKFL